MLRNANKCWMTNKGMTFQLLKQFVDESEENGRKLTGLSTREVCEYIKQDTATTGCSYISYLETKGVELSDATVFISHAWQTNFIDLLHTLQTYFAGVGNGVVWLDIFCVNQHLHSTLNETITFEEWSSAFRTVIKNCELTLLILSPLNNPLPLQRSWCLFEMFTVKDLGCNLEILLQEREKSLLLKQLTESPDFINDLDKMFSQINVKNSKATNRVDQNRIFQAVGTFGFDKINIVVLEQLRNWIATTLEQSLSGVGMTDTEKAKLKMALGATYLHLGRFEKSIPVYHDCLKTAETTGDQMMESDVLLNLAFSNYAVRDLKNGIKMAHKALEIKRLLHCSNHEEMKVLNMLGGLYYTHNQLIEAEMYYLDALKINKVIKKDHMRDVAVVNNIAVFYSSQGRYELAMNYFELFIAFAKELREEENPQALNAMNNYGSLISLKGRQQNNLKMLTEAQKILEKCWNIRKRVLSGDNFDTLSSMHEVARIYHSMGKYKKALKLCSFCHKKRIEVVGLSKNHQLVLGSINLLADIYTSLKRFDKALSLYRACLIARRVVFGWSHPETISLLRDLGRFYQVTNNYNLAEKYLRICLLQQEYYLMGGKTHPETVFTERLLESLRKLMSDVTL